MSNVIDIKTRQPAQPVETVLAAFEATQALLLAKLNEEASDVTSDAYLKRLFKTNARFLLTLASTAEPR